MGLRTVILALGLLLATAGTARADVTAELLRGARAFRAGRYVEALEHFQSAERAGPVADLALYMGPTFYKLGRFEEALAMLSRMRRTGTRDAVAEYYLGLCRERLGLLVLARQVFAELDREAAGPRLAEGATRFLADIERRTAAATGGAAALLARAEALASGRPNAALDFAEEALLRSPAGAAERPRAALRLAELAVTTGQPLVAVRLLGTSMAALEPIAQVALARAALLAGDGPLARRLLDDAAARGNEQVRQSAESLRSRLR
jgi:tetratricopeptide (TPR) repeat protein